MIKKFLIFILVVIYFLALLPVFFSLTFFRTFLSQSFLENRFIPQTYEKTVVLAKDAFKDTTLIKNQDFEKKFREVFPESVYTELLQKFLGEVVAGIKKWQKGSGLEIILKDSKAQFITRLEKAIDQLPVCPAGIYPSEKNFCLPKNMTESEKMKLKNKLKEDADLQLPSRIVISEKELKNSNGKLLAFLSFSLRNYYQIMAILLGVPLIFLILIGLLVFQPLRRVFLWEGFLILFTSFIPLTLWILFQKFPDFVKKSQPMTEKIYSNAVFLTSFLANWNKEAGFSVLFIAVLILLTAIVFRKKLSK